MAIEKTVNKKGIDVSQWQGNIDFSKAKADGIDFVIIRAGYGKVASQKDPFFDSNYNAAKRAGLGVGVYWYSYADSVESAIQEAKTCLDVIKGKTFEYPIYFDIEEKSQFNKGKAFCSNITRAFCNSIEKAGYWAGIYTGRFAINTYFDDEIKSGKRYALWIAEWASRLSFNGDCGMWQSSDKGKVKGINGNVDMDICYVDYPTLIKNAGLNGFTKSTTTSAPTKPTTPTTPAPTTKTIKAGQAVVLNGANLYSASTSTMPANHIIGTFYVWDATIINNRIRITNIPSNVGKIGQVTGWIAASLVK